MESFYSLLDDYDATGDDNVRRKLESKLWTRYGQERAIFVLDMSGFTRLTERYGVVHYLSMIQQMKIIVGPIVENSEGSIIEFHADNCLAKFVSVESAALTSIKIMKELEIANRHRDLDRRINVCCGIDFGTIIFIEDGLFAGGPINRASRLGEDIARPGEILLTMDAINDLRGDTPIKYQEYEGETPNNLEDVHRILY